MQPSGTEYKEGTIRNKKIIPRTRKRKRRDSLPKRERSALRETLFDAILESKAMGGLPDIYPENATTVEEQLAFLLILKALNGDTRACKKVFDIAEAE